MYCWKFWILFYSERILELTLCWNLGWCRCWVGLVGTLNWVGLVRCFGWYELLPQLILSCVKFIQLWIQTISLRLQNPNKKVKQPAKNIKRKKSIPLLPTSTDIPLNWFAPSYNSTIRFPSIYKYNLFWPPSCSCHHHNYCISGKFSKVQTIVS